MTASWRMPAEMIQPMVSRNDNHSRCLLTLRAGSLQSSPCAVPAPTAPPCSAWPSSSLLPAARHPPPMATPLLRSLHDCHRCPHLQKLRIVGGHILRPTHYMGTLGVETTKEPYLNLENLLLRVIMAASISESHPAGTPLPWRRFEMQAISYRSKGCKWPVSTCFYQGYEAIIMNGRRQKTLIEGITKNVKMLRWSWVEGDDVMAGWLMSRLSVLIPLVLFLLIVPLLPSLTSPFPPFLLPWSSIPPMLTHQKQTCRCGGIIWNCSSILSPNNGMITVQDREMRYPKYIATNIIN